MVLAPTRSTDFAEEACLILGGQRLQITGAFDEGSVGLQLCYILSLESFGAFSHFEFNTVAFVERFEATALNGAVMHKDIISGITADKTIAFFVIKPLHGSLFFHLFSYPYPF